MALEDSATPFALKAVAVIFILSGLLAALDMLYQLWNGQISLNIGILGIFIGIGLLRCSPAWRICALVFTCFGMTGALVAILALVFFGRSIEYAGPDNAGELPLAVGLASAIVGFLIALWLYRVLTRPHIKQLFVRGNAA